MGSGDFEFADPYGSRIFQDHARLKARAAANIEAARRAQSKAKPTPTKAKPSKKAKKAKADAKPEAPSKPSSRREPVVAPVTSGPGAKQVGAAPSQGPGQSSVATAPDVPTKGPGRASAGAAKAGTGAGNATAGEIFIGPEPVVTAGDDGENRTAVQVGPWLQPNPWVSDMQAIENRYGDDGPVAFVAPFIVLGADLWNTVDVYAGRPRSGPSPKLIDQWIGEENHQNYLTTKRKLDDTSWYAPREYRTGGGF